MLSNIKVHPAAALFPMIEEKDLRALADDIAMNGQIHPIIVSNGVLIDGRNRLAACEFGKIEPKWETREFASEGEIIRFVIAANERRRHLNASQRAIIAAGLANIERGDTLKQNQQVESNAQDCATDVKDPAISQEDAAKAMGVSRRSVQDAKKVQRQAPALVEKIRDGEISVAAAAKLSDSPAEVKKVIEGADAKQTVKEANAAERKEHAVAEAKDDKKASKATEDRIAKLVAENAAKDKRIDELNARIESMGASMDEMHEDLKAMNSILNDAPDPVKEAVKLEKSARDQLKAAKSQASGMMQAKNEAIRQVTGLKRSVDRLEKELAALKAAAPKSKKAA